MNNPTLQKLDELRSKGLRPCVVGVFINSGRVLLLNKKEWKLWLLPQGGIDNKENTFEALKREMAEELGVSFNEDWKYEPVLLFEDSAITKNLHNNRNLVTDAGTDVTMIGKHYFYYLIKTDDTELSIKDTEFDEYKWLTYAEALQITASIYQETKKRALLKLLNLLQKTSIIA